MMGKTWAKILPDTKRVYPNTIGRFSPSDDPPPNKFQYNDEEIHKKYWLKE